MRKGWRISLTVFVVAAVMAMFMVLGKISADQRHTVACTGIDVRIADSTGLRLITKPEILGILGREYGHIVGQRSEDVNLFKIENILDGKNAVLKSQAYMTKDGRLHISIRQREPVLLFLTPGFNFFADNTGYIFPFQSGYNPSIMKVEGSTPLKVTVGYKGEAASEREREWLSSMIGLEDFLRSDRTWKDSAKKIVCDHKGNLVIYPSQGRERFIFGPPYDTQRKFDYLEKYYKYIVPTQDEGHYGSVNVKYEGLIICRKN